MKVYLSRNDVLHFIDAAYQKEFGWILIPQLDYFLKNNFNKWILACDNYNDRELIEFCYEGLDDDIIDNPKTQHIYMNRLFETFKPYILFKNKQDAIMFKLRWVK